MKTWSCFNRRSLAAAFLLTALAPLSTLAQTFVSPGLQSWTSATPHRGTTTQPPGFLSNILSALDTDVPLYRAGPVALRPHAVYQAVRSTGVDIGPHRTIDTDTQTVAPGLLVEGGSHWQADYTGSWTYYTARELKDSFDQTARVWGEYEFRTWQFGVSGEYASTYPMMVEFALQTHDISGAVNGHTTLFLTDRAQLLLTASYIERLAHPLNPATEWLPSDMRNSSSTDLLQWKSSDRLTFGAGASFGYSDASVGASMSYVRPMVRVTWMPTDRVTAIADAGYERHRFSHTNAQALNNPYYNGTVTYVPYNTTTLTVTLSRGVSASQLADIVTEVSGWLVTVRQRLLERLFFNGMYSQQNTHYREARSDLPLARGDRYDTTDIRLGVPVLSRGAASVFFRRVHNRSSHSFYSFDTRQLGVEVSFSF